MAQNGSFPILNPYTPLAFLTPEVADTTSLYRYVIVGTLSVMIWDLLQAFPEDYRVIFRQRFSYRTIIFVAARLFTVAFFAMAAVFSTAQLPKCNLTNKVTWALYIVANLATSLLLYIRLCTLFQKNYAVISTFAVGLILVIGGGIASVFATTGANIGPTDYCILYVTGSYMWVTTMASFIFDTSICGTLIWKLDAVSKEEHVGQKSVLQKLVQDGRVYLFIIALLKVPLIIIFFVLRHQSGSDNAIQLVFLFPDIVLVHILSTRIYRDNRLRKAAALLPTAGKTGSGHAGPMSFLQGVDSHGDSLQAPSSNALYSSKTDQEVSLPPGINVEKEIVDDSDAIPSMNVVKFEEAGRKSDEYAKAS